PIAVIAEKGEDIAKIGAGAPAPAAAPSKSGPQPARPAQRSSAGEAKPEEAEPEEAGDGRLRVSPVARRMAEDRGIDLNKLRGSGPSGRIIKRDVIAAAEGASETAEIIEAARPLAVTRQRVQPEPGQTVLPGPLAPTLGKTVALSSIRQTIAKR